MVDYSLWEVIENGNAPPITQVVETIFTHATVEEKAQKRIDMKARSTLLMGIPDKHQLKFNSIKDAKSLLQAVEKRFEGNAATKKTQRNLLKQQYENFTESSSKVLDQTFDRLKKLISQLDIHGESISQEDVNQKFLRNLRWQMAMLTMRARRFLKNTGRKFSLDGNETIGFDKSKVECYNCHKRGHFARECRAPRSQDTKHKETIRRTVPVETPALATLVVDKCKTGLGYNPVPPPYTGNVLPPKPDLSDLEEFANEPIVTEPTIKKHVVESSKAKASTDKPKVDERNIMIRNKARLVAQGHTQEEGIDYDEVFASVARIEAMRLFLAYASFKDFWCSKWMSKVIFSIERLKKRGKIDKTLFIRRHKDDILLVQVYVDDIIFEVKNASTPMETQKPLLKDEDGEEVDVYMYRSIIGSFMYLTSLRHDIMFEMCACARYQVNLKVSHFHDVKRTFRYLKGQPKFGLWYPKDSPFDLVAYTDSDYARASLDRKSTTGGCQFFGCRLISWQRKKQTVVANSKTKVEYVAASSCCGQLKVNAVRHKLIAAGLMLMLLLRLGLRGVLDLETTKTTQALEIDNLKWKVKWLERRKRSKTHRLKRLYKVGLPARVESSKDEGLGEEDAFKQGMIVDIDANEDIILVSTHDEKMFDADQDVGEKRRKFFAAKRAEEKRNKPPTQAQERKIMCTYLKNIEGKKLTNLKNKSFDSIQNMFDRAYRRVNTFVDYITELVEESSKKAKAEVTKGSSKRAGSELEQESAKKQKIDDDKDIDELQ
uniref:CCHC-type domain-containing protein n=1 Tax=Tanacetum cinerariifolium TaxID=118510 RepID=A0A699GZH0_TANCI|nr:hypothetical protein [Tanacetum cinerariifolium]